MELVDSFFKNSEKCDLCFSHCGLRIFSLRQSFLSSFLHFPLSYFTFLFHVFLLYFGTHRGAFNQI